MKTKIGLVLKSLEADFFKQMKADTENWASKQPDIELTIVGTKSQTDIDEQINLVNKLIEDKISILVLIPIDSKRLVPSAIRAVKKGIQVVNLDIRLDQDLLKEENISIPFVGPDNEAASMLVGELLAKRLKENDKVVIIEGVKAADNCQKRTKGFENIIKKHNLNLIAKQAADWEISKAENVFHDIFIDNKDIKGVFCDNDAMALGVCNVLRKYNQNKNIEVVGFDNDINGQALLKSGDILATIDAYGSKMAIEGIKYGLEILKDKSLANKSINTHFNLITIR